MSYVHCPTCLHAYNLAVQRVCPGCSPRDVAVAEPLAPPAEPDDPVDAIVAAADRLASAINRATPEQLAAARAALDAREPVRVEPRALPPSPQPPALVAAVLALLEPARERLRGARYAMFLFAKSQFTRFHQASMNFGRALR